MFRLLLHRHSRKYRTMWVVFTATILLILISFIPLRLAVAYLQYPSPDTILTLGGGIERERFTAEFAQNHPDTDIWVSTGVSPKQAQPLFQQAQIPDDHIYLDRRAIDTVTNFTSLVHDFKAQDIHHVYLITSDFHMRRSTTIAFFVFGSQGIAYTPVAIPSNRPDESLFRVARDAGRSLLWLATGRTGASLHPKFRQT